ncbi:MAG: hypothetical protein LKF96_06655 [Treponema sp.]|nr:hypothetical protein [Treponema sp.]
MTEKKKVSIILMGMKHCGKSTHGKRLAGYLNCPFFDTDYVIKEQTGMTAREIYTVAGETGFKTAELAACRYIASCLGNHRAVIATGGGVCNNQEALDCLHPFGFFVFLKAAEKDSADRIVNEMTVTPEGNLGNLPAYIAKENPHTESDVRGLFHRFYTDRIGRYTAVADTTITLQPVSCGRNFDRIKKCLVELGKI